ncbi:MAG: hypothetical protein LQ346_007328 [Caloplaca aetnensis]|nr:MAG: hypothetical protein LQ346_007328 [Caloplaca aetnensis]
MRQTLTHGWKFLTSKIHQPLPLNHRDSQKLLTLLNESFKRNLDHRYPEGLADSEQSPDSHFQSVLKSPLFAARQARRHSTPGRQKDIERDAAQVRDLVLAIKEPVDHFRQQVASGAANLESAKLALENQRRKALASASADARDGMRQSGIASVMVNWLWSSGQYERMDFIWDRTFIARLMPFVVAEGQYKPAWDWLQRLQSTRRPTDLARKTLQNHVGFVVRMLLRAEVTHGYGLQSAIQMFLTHLRSTTLPSAATSPYGFVRGSQQAAWWLISELTFRKTASEVEGSILDSFDASVNMWASSHLVLPYRALIQLLNPTKSKTLPLSQLMSTIESSSTMFGEQERLAFVHIGLKAVEVLLGDGSIKEANQVMDALQSTFASELGTPLMPWGKYWTNKTALLHSFNKHGHIRWTLPA